MAAESGCIGGRRIPRRTSHSWIWRFSITSRRPWGLSATVAARSGILPNTGGCGSTCAITYAVSYAGDFSGGGNAPEWLAARLRADVGAELGALTQRQS